MKTIISAKQTVNLNTNQTTNILLISQISTNVVFNLAQQLEPRKWQWATPLIEGVPPCARGGHSATLWEVSIVVFGVKSYFLIVGPLLCRKKQRI